MSPLQHKTVHPNGMEVVANVTETCYREVRQKLLLKGSHVHKDILMNRFERFGENAGREMLKV